MAIKLISPQKTSVYMIGIGGIGVSALARYFLAKNWLVSGSDAADSLITQELRKDGIKVKIRPKKPYFSPKTALLVHSQAIPAKNPEILAAKAAGIPVLAYPEAIGFLTEKYQTVAIAGAHGKSTTTGLLAEIFLRAKKDPTVIIGTKLKSLANPPAGGNFRMGKSDWLVLEADEFGGAFWHYSPAAALITNIDREHLDFYKNLNGVKKSFLRFIGNIKENGLLILNKDDKNLLSLKKQIEKIAGQKKIKTVWYSLAANPLLTAKIRGWLKIPGRHNLGNALGAYQLAKELKIKEKDILAGLKNFAGAWRRFEYKGKFEIRSAGRRTKLKIFDDYAHHPTEIKATLAAAKEKFPDSKIVCIFQPHQRERLKRLFKDFANSFENADSLILLPAYQVTGRDNKKTQYDSRALFNAIHKNNKTKEIYYLQSPANLKKLITNIVIQNSIRQPADKTQNYCLIMMGAGNINELTKNIVD